MDKILYENYLIQQQTHIRIFEQYNKHDSRNDTDGFYIITMRIFDYEKKVLCFSYIRYNYDLIGIFNAYILTRNHLSTNYYESGYYFVLMDYNILKPEDRKLETMYIYNNKLEDINKVDAVDKEDWIRVLRRTVHVSDTKSISDITYKSFQGKYNDVIKSVYSTELTYDITEERKGTNILNNILFIAKDLRRFIANIKNQGLAITQGSKKFRSLINTRDNFLVGIDNDFRHLMHSHYQQHKSRLNYDLYKYRLSRKHFSFDNIHQNINNLRCYSGYATKKVDNSKAICTESLFKNFINRGTNKIHYIMLIILIVHLVITVIVLYFFNDFYTLNSFIDNSDTYSNIILTSTDSIKQDYDIDMKKQVSNNLFDSKYRYNYNQYFTHKYLDTKQEVQDKSFILNTVLQERIRLMEHELYATHKTICNLNSEIARARDINNNLIKSIDDLSAYLSNIGRKP